MYERDKTFEKFGKYSMKTIIAGSRNVQRDTNQIQEIIDTLPWKISEVVCGEAKGIDRSGKDWAVANKIPVKSFPADWDEYKKAAGYIRNRKMAKYADALLAIWDGKSKGTKNMIDEARKLNLTYHVVMTEYPMPTF